MRRKKVILWVIVVALFLAGAVAFVVYGTRQMALRMANPRVLVSSSPSGTGELHLMASGLVDTDIEMYVIPRGQTEPVRVPCRHDGGSYPLGGAFWFCGLAWSADGTVCAVKMRYGTSSENLSGYAAAYDFKESKAYPMTWALWETREPSKETQAEAIAQNKALDLLMKDRGGAIPDSNITDGDAFNKARPLTWSEWKKYLRYGEAD